jgi:hypothetical protein
MNPATKKYPRPNLPLLCNWFKQRNERHLIVSLVSAKNLGYGDHALKGQNCGGRPVAHLSGCAQVTGALVLRTAVAALKGNSTAAGQVQPVDGHIFFFPFFFCKLMLVVLKPPAPKQHC